MKTWTPPKSDHSVRAQNCIAQGALTNSKRPESFIKGIYPTHLRAGKGAMVYDVEGRSYIDFIGGLGSSSIGYADDEVNNALFYQLRSGATLSLSTDIEVRFAEKLKEYFPFISHMKIMKTGTEACIAAVKIARAFTQKKDPRRLMVLSEGYHGWSDEFVSLTPPGYGVPPFVNIKKLNTNYTEDDLIQASCVIIEPVMTDISDSRISWLRKLREDCTRTGCILIFDEIVTGFRFPKFSVSKYFGIEPDIICLGKGLANGLPIAVVAGNSEIMNNDYFVSGTFCGETISMAAGLKVMELLQNKYQIERTWEAGAAFIKEFNEINSNIQLNGYPTRGRFDGDPMFRSLFWQESCKAGVLWGASYFFNHCHMEHTYDVLNISRDIVGKIKSGQVKLEGFLPQSPFSQKVRDDKAGAS